MSNDLNPYKKLGEYDPFGVADIFGLPFSLGEAFKKLTCAGIDGRLKSKKQDYKEAAYSIQYAMDNKERFSLKKTATADTVNAVMLKYDDVFHNIPESAREAAQDILFFARSGDIVRLKYALDMANYAHRWQV